MQMKTTELTGALLNYEVLHGVVSREIA